MIKGVEGKLKGNDYNSAENVAYVILDEHDYIDRVEIIKVGASVLKNKKVAAINRDKEDKNRFSIEYYEDGGMMAKGGRIDEINMDEVESAARFYSDESRWITKPTISKFEEEIKEAKDLKHQLDNNEIRPSKIIGSGLKPNYVRPLAYKYLNERILIAEKAIEILKQREGRMAMGGVTFKEKVRSVKSTLLKGKKVSPKVQKDYGKTYSPKEAEESAKRIVGAMTAKERLMKSMKKGKK
jgi:hypothetical protein